MVSEFLVRRKNPSKRAILVDNLSEAAHWVNHNAKFSQARVNSYGIEIGPLTGSVVIASPGDVIILDDDGLVSIWPSVLFEHAWYEDAE